MTALTVQPATSRRSTNYGRFFGHIAYLLLHRGSSLQPLLGSLVGEDGVKERELGRGDGVKNGSFRGRDGVKKMLDCTWAILYFNFNS